MHSRPRGPSCLHGGGKKKKITADKYGLPLLWASGLSRSTRAEIQTKAIKASAIYTFPKQDCGIHSPLLEWDLHGDADIREQGEILSSACMMKFSLQEWPLPTKLGISLQPWPHMFEATPANCVFIRCLPVC